VMCVVLPLCVIVWVCVSLYLPLSPMISPNRFDISAMASPILSEASVVFPAVTADSACPKYDVTLSAKVVSDCAATGNGN